MHYSQLRTAVESTLQSNSGEGEVLRVRMQGFISNEVLAAHLGELAARVERQAPMGILCDLRAIAGYDSRASVLVREACMLVRRAGIRRIALVASSSVLRTHIRMLARDLDLELRCFLGQTEAARWLEST